MCFQFFIIIKKGISKGNKYSFNKKHLGIDILKKIQNKNIKNLVYNFNFHIILNINFDSKLIVFTEGCRNLFK